MVPTYEQAWMLLRQYNTEPFLLKHGLIVSGVMKEFAKKLGFEHESDFWGVVGLLHDLDFQLYPEAHCIKQVELLKAHDIDERIIRATVSHGYGLTVDIKPEHIMEKVLYAADELTGLIGAAARMRPSRSVQDLELSSVLKKFKTPKFAAGCSREVIGQGADMLGWTIDELIESTIMAMRADEAAIEAQMQAISPEGNVS